jgi:SAM-dependent methyltransferase
MKEHRMATHQQLTGTSDEAFLQRMIDAYPQQFGAPFWTYLSDAVFPHVPAKPVVVDLGCGPGLFLRDMHRYAPEATLYGYDITPAMIDYGQQLLASVPRSHLALHDLTTGAIPLATGTAHLVLSAQVLHLFEDPLAAFADILRVLAPGGYFVLYDWRRIPLAEYLIFRMEVWGESQDISRQRGFRLFPMQNRYALEDWQWLLAEAGFTVQSQRPIPPTHHIFVATAAGTVA